MVVIPAGEFDMGSPETELGRRGNDEARHHVVIPKPFGLATTETTQAVWAAVMGSNPSKYFVGETLPMTHVSWEEWQLFLAELNKKVPGGGFRLPTEAEWEFACRAGSRSRYCFGDDEKDLPGYAWYAANSGKSVHPVGLLKPNAWGLHDMHGNVEEWCEDRGVRAMMAPQDGAGERITERVMRSGCHRSQAGDVRCSSRGMLSQGLNGLDVLGCRLARTVVADTSPSQVPGAASPVPAPDTAPVPKDPSKPGPPTPPGPQVPNPPGEPTPPVAPLDKEGEVPSWAKVAPEQIEAARKAGVPVAFENSIGMRFVLIPAGTFTMGSPETEEGRQDDETPHEVTLTRPYYVGTTEVTNAQYRRFKPAHHSTPFLRRDFDYVNQPVVNVTWEDAVAFAEWLSSEERSRTYRLPTGAEWERACRAGSTTPYWWGREITTRQANYDGREVYRGGQKGEFRGTAVPVGTLPPSPWGLYEVHGNVYEWCSDWRGVYPRGPATDPTGPASGEFRVLRGGCWISAPADLRSAYRDQFDPKDNDNYFGIRLAASVPSE
jgi:formylglycine-generating enzyme required for sulfatase activity